MTPPRPPDRRPVRAPRGAGVEAVPGPMRGALSADDREWLIDLLRRSK